LLRPSFSLLCGRAMESPAKLTKTLRLFAAEALKVFRRRLALHSTATCRTPSKSIRRHLRGTNVHVSGFMRTYRGSRRPFPATSACTLAALHAAARPSRPSRRSRPSRGKASMVRGLINNPVCGSRGDRALRPRSPIPAPGRNRALRWPRRSGRADCRHRRQGLAGEKLLTRFDLTMPIRAASPSRRPVFPVPPGSRVSIRSGAGNCARPGSSWGWTMDFRMAFLKSQRRRRPPPEAARSSSRLRGIPTRRASPEAARNLGQHGFTLIATSGTATFLEGRRPARFAHQQRCWKASRILVGRQ